MVKASFHEAEGLVRKLEKSVYDRDQRSWAMFLDPRSQQPKMILMNEGKFGEVMRLAVYVKRGETETVYKLGMELSAMYFLRSGTWGDARFAIVANDGKTVIASSEDPSVTVRVAALIHSNPERYGDYRSDPEVPYVVYAHFGPTASGQVVNFAMFELNIDLAKMVSYELEEMLRMTEQRETVYRAPACQMKGCDDGGSMGDKARYNLGDKAQRGDWG